MSSDRSAVASALSRSQPKREASGPAPPWIARSPPPRPRWRRHGRGGQRRGAQQADAEQRLGLVAGDRFQRPGGLGGGVERAGVADGGAGGDDDEERHQAGEDRAADGIDAFEAVLVGGDALVG